MAQIFASILLFYTLAGLTIFEDLTPICVNLFKEEWMFTNIPRPSFLNQIQCRKDISASSWRKSFSRCYRINSSNFPIIMKISFPLGMVHPILSFKQWRKWGQRGEVPSPNHRTGLAKQGLDPRFAATGSGLVVSKLLKTSLNFLLWMTGKI